MIKTNITYMLCLHCTRDCSARALTRGVTDSTSCTERKKIYLSGSITSLVTVGYACYMSIHDISYHYIANWHLQMGRY